MANVTVTIRTVDDAAIPALVDGVLVRVFDAPGDTYITEGTTGTVTPGEVDFTLFGNAGGVGYTFILSKSGVSFPPAPTKQDSVFDPPAPSNIFQYTAHIGQVGQNVKFSVQTDDLVPQPVEGMTILVFDETDIYLTEFETDAAGEATLVLEGDPDPGRLYIVRLRPLAGGQSIVGGPTQTIRVLEPLVPPATNIFDFVTASEELPASTNPDMCLMSGKLADQALRPLNKMNLRFIPIMEDPDAKLSGFPFPSDPTVLQRQMLLRETVFQTASDGSVQVLLPQGAIYDVHIHGFELPGLPTVAQIQVPQTTSAQLEDVLFPYTASVEWGTDTVAVAVGGTEAVSVNVLGSNDQVIPPSLFECFLELSIDDSDVATFAMNEEGELVITGVSAGVAQISVARKPGTSAPRVPEIPDLITAPSALITVTVT